MERTIPVRTGRSLQGITAFLLIGLFIYLVLLAGAEWLTYAKGHMNPILKVDRADAHYDWVILGASHAMPLDYGDFNSQMEATTGQKILNLAGPGTGPLYNRFVLDHFRKDRHTSNILYVVDAFALRSALWNEGRLEDPKMLARTPLHLSVAVRLVSYVLSEGVNPRSWLGYATGFFKLNDSSRFQRDLFEGEMHFERVFKPSATADRKRIDYLYPQVANEDGEYARYFAVLGTLIDTAHAAGTTVTLAKFPIPDRFAALLPGEAQFNGRLAAFADAKGIELYDFTSVLDDERFYADTDHLNQTGARLLVERHLAALMVTEGRHVGVR